MPKKEELKNSYFIDNPERLEEMVRLSKQAALFNRLLGPLLPRVNSGQVLTVLDIACGPGTWVLDVATAYPHIEVTGFDLSHRMIEYAQNRAEAEGLTNAHFFVGDATKQFPLHGESFDVVNARTILGFMMRDQWKPLIHECTRVLRRGGIIHLLETEAASVVSTGDVYTRLIDLITRALWKSGMSFCSSGSYFGITAMLSAFLLQVGYAQETIVETPYSINYSYGSEAHLPINDVFLAPLPGIKEFLLRFQLVTEREIDTLLEDVRQASFEENFRALWYTLSVSALKR